MPANWERPQSEPTIMSYFIVRIRLGEISRRIADLDSMSEWDQVSIDEVISVDNEFETALNDLPVFLRTDDTSLWKTSHLEAEHPHLPLQRYVVNAMLSARRCKFHGPFLLRAVTDKSYAPFRLECLRSARAVIKARNDLATKADIIWLANSKLSGVLHLYFYAVVVHLIDLSVNRSAGDEKARKAEIHDACKTLESARHQSVPAGLFLDSLMAVMQKHRIRLQGMEGSQEDVQMTAAMSMRIVGFMMTPLLALVILLVRLPADSSVKSNTKWPAELREERKAYRADLKKPPFLLLCAGLFFLYLAISSPFLFVSTYAVKLGMSRSLTFYLVSIVNGASFFGRALPGFVADRLGKFNILIASSFFAAILAFCWTAATSTAGAILSLQLACATTIVHESITTTAVGIGMGSGSTSGLFGSPIAGKLTERRYLSLAIFTGAMLMAGTVFTTLSRLHQNRKIMVAL